MQGPVNKRDYRQRAHANSFKDTGITIPFSPEHIDWTTYYTNKEAPTYLDIGCGYGKFIMDLSTKIQENILGLEIREKVYEFLKAKIIEKNLQNCAVIKTNALLFLINFFKKRSLQKIFILFPDPHFKKRKQKGRIVCRQTIATFEYLLNDNGLFYISTDVIDLFTDMKNTILDSKLFVEVSKVERELDEFYHMTLKGTDEAMRAGVKTSAVYATIFKKKSDC